MNSAWPLRKTARALRLASLLLVLPAAAASGAWSLDWWTIDGGGEMFSAAGAWQLSGTLGQGDDTASLYASGGGWTLTGGFWSATVAQTDRIFRDGFEE